MASHFSASLKESEKFLVVFFLLLFLTFTAISHYRHRSTSLELEQKISSLKFCGQKKYLVTIEGAVLKPGSFSVLAGSSLEKILHKAKVLPYANLREIDPQMKVEQDLYFFLEELDQIEVEVKGAVIEEKKIFLHKGATFSDLKGKIDLKASADPRFFRKRKKIIDRSVIEIPEISEKACD